jgi:hypothetical protein
MSSLRPLPAALLAALLLSACGERQGSRDLREAYRSALPAEEPAAQPPSDHDPEGGAVVAARPDTLPERAFEGTVGIVTREHQARGVATLEAARAASHTGFDRVVFEFRDDILPGYHLEYVDRPVRDCGSGDPIPVEGDGYLMVRMQPARAHTDAYQATVTVAERRRRLDHPNLKALVSTCDFEAVLEWVLGVGSPNRYRVTELREPARLVVDVLH